MSLLSFILVLATFIMALQTSHKVIAIEGRRAKALKAAEDERDQLRYVLAEVLGADGEVVGRLEMPEPEPEQKALPPAEDAAPAVVSAAREAVQIFRQPETLGETIFPTSPRCHAPPIDPPRPPVYPGILGRQEQLRRQRRRRRSGYGDVARAARKRSKMRSSSSCS